MDTILKLLKSSKYVVDAERVIITEEDAKSLSERQRALLDQRTREVVAYKITYRSGRLKIKGFLVLPKNRRGTLPCIISNRGGTGDFGAWTPVGTVLRNGLFASWNYVVISSQYRGNDGSDGTEEWGGGDVDDVLVLKKVLDELPMADTSRIGMIGGSRGGMMTYLSAKRAKWLKAAVCIAGTANLSRAFQQRTDLKKLIQKLIGTSRASVASRSAVRWPKAFSKKIPFLIMHGTADWRVDPRDSMDLSRALLDAHIPHRLIMYEGADHSLSECSKEANGEIRKWLDRYVRDSAKLPNLTPHGD